MIAGRSPGCRSMDLADKRTRCSVLLEWFSATDAPLNMAAPIRPFALLVDTSPELRLQALRCGLRRVDAILLTHTHADHLMGLDDVRRFLDCQRLPYLDLYSDEASLQQVARVFDYAVDDGTRTREASRPLLRLRPIRPYEPFQLHGVRITPLQLYHGRTTVIGLLVEHPSGRRLAYCTDCAHIDEPALEALRGVDLLVLDALRPEPHPTHFSVAQALAIADRIGPGQTWFTHAGSEVRREAVEQAFPDGVRYAWDGLVLQLD